jgi:hypothetical protein
MRSNNISLCGRIREKHRLFRLLLLNFSAANFLPVRKIRCGDGKTNNQIQHAGSHLHIECSDSGGKPETAVALLHNYTYSRRVLLFTHSHRQRRRVLPHQKKWLARTSPGHHSARRHFRSTRRGGVDLFRGIRSAI